MSYKIAVVGATGNVGRVMLEVLEERNFPVKEVIPIASEHSVGKEVSYGEKKKLKVRSLNNFSFDEVDIALFSAGSHVSKHYAPMAAKSNCVVIDNSSYFRKDETIPLIVPEVNAESLKDYSNHNIISNPNCAVIQLVTVLKPLYDYMKIKRIVISTYQSVSGAGKKAMDELYNQTKTKFLSSDIVSKVFPKVIAFNIIPQIDELVDDGYTKEEHKLINETRRILGDKSIGVSATCVRVPVFVGHSESVNIEFSEKVDIKDIIKILKNSPFITFMDNDYMTPIDCVGFPTVYVSRLRKDHSNPNAFDMWIVTDNLRKGAALNAIQIAEKLISYITPKNI